MTRHTAPPYAYFDLKPAPQAFAADVIAGFRSSPKHLSPKYFYDARGSELFEAICGLPEYYPTRTELGMLRALGVDLRQRVGPGAAVIEYGSGSGLKTALLIHALSPAAYVAIDISGEQLERSVAALASEFRAVHVIGVCADYSGLTHIPGLESAAGARRVIFFPGSTIGNLTPSEAHTFLRNAREVAGRHGAMIIGVDLKKDLALLHAAYNDAQGVTAQFNLNLLERMNRELEGDFDVSAFRHRAFFNEREGRIEMHLVSLREQRVHVAGQEFRFSEGEAIHTENSYKYSVDDFRRIAAGAGWTPEHCWTDAANLFSIHYLTTPV